MTKKTEINFGIDSKLEIRDANKKAGFIGQIAGYAIVFNKPSVPNAPFIEYIAPTALDNVDLSDVLALYLIEVMMIRLGRMQLLLGIHHQ